MGADGGEVGWGRWIEGQQRAYEVARHVDEGSEQALPV